MNAIKMKRILINICKYVLLIFAAFITGAHRVLYLHRL